MDNMLSLECNALFTEYTTNWIFKNILAQKTKA